MVKKTSKSPMNHGRALLAAVRSSVGQAFAHLQAMARLKVMARLNAGAKSTIGRFNLHGRKKSAPRSQERAPAKQQRRALLASVFHAGLLAFSLMSVGASGALWVAFKEIAPQETATNLWAVNRLPAIVILDRNGNELASRGARYGEAVGVDDLPTYVVNAFLSTEDRRFYAHGGIDLRGTLRAFLRNTQSGSVVEGGSTITQQLARNLFLSPEQTYIRKAREAMLAIWIEGRFSKDEILSLYLNRIYLGAGAYGIDSAAKTYFNKSARDISLSEAVMLAGLPKAPSTLAPTQNPIGAQDRAIEVLNNLREINSISPFEARQARANPAKIKTAPYDAELGYIFDYVAAKAKKLTPDRSGDLIVQTTLDAETQEIAERAVKSAITVDARLAGAEQAALVAYDTNGALRAMVGGRSYVESQFNRATQAKRQPGSAFKPFVYAAAFETNNISPASRFIDQPIKIGEWEPKNYANGYLGEMRLTEAMAKSVNSIAVQVSEFAGRQAVADLAERLGIRTKLPAVPSIALGGANVTLEELTSAYIPFATQGVKHKPYVIDQITDGKGNILFTQDTPGPVRVLDARLTADISHLLYQVVTTGTGRRAHIGRHQIVGKTGTTNDWRDAWFLGYSTHLVTGVWVGNDDFRAMNKITGGGLPAEIWHNFMTAAHTDLPRKSIPGAYPATTYIDEEKLLGFYGGVISDLRRVRRGASRGFFNVE